MRSRSIPTETVSGLDEMIRFAWDQRPDVRAAGVQVHAAEEARRAATSESLPSLSFNADYEASSVSIRRNHTAHSVLPETCTFLFFVVAGSRPMSSRQAPYSPSAAPNSKTFAGALNRTYAMPNSMSITASEQIRLAESNRRLAAETLEQAKDRFKPQALPTQLN